ncbi:MAG TPA: NAD(P)H-binding protein [Pirellulaceae bacterium]|jgi:uncharacterized protein YbjT (DUF2867 family)|nr:NAD(P)H-binding protein [Pirellulaceae bacterium]
MENPTVLLTGATGYVGGMLLPELEREGLRVRCLVRDRKKAAKLACGAEIQQGDVLDRAALERAMQGVETAYFLVHLMGGGRDFRELDRESAENFAAAAKAAGVSRIIYLGGLGDEDDRDLSPHLRSRHDVGRILRDSGVETIEFRASIVVGAGSLSFEIVRNLTDRLPVMICPRWLETPTQPIAIDDVLAYLLAARRLPAQGSRLYEIGSPDVVSYGELIRMYADERRLRRLLIPVPLLSPYLSSLWLALITPATAPIGRHLIEGLRNPTVVRRPLSAEAFAIRPRSVRQAIREACDALESRASQGGRAVEA